ncbi:hypothetical protein JZU51_03280, partial [bacterium]|nr:hypothetical protein [bacterium]
DSANRFPLASRPEEGFLLAGRAAEERETADSSRKDAVKTGIDSPRDRTIPCNSYVTHEGTQGLTLIFFGPD